MIQVQHYGILIADDEYFLRQSLKRSLEEFTPDFIVEGEAADGREALGQLASGQIHLLFTDIRMPVMDGLELAAEVHRLYPSVVTVILTGYADFEYAREALRSGVADFLLKPVDTDKLETVMARVRRILQQTYTLPEETSQSRRDPEDIVRQVIAYMQTHYMEEIDFGQLSHDMGFTSAYLTKLFNRYAGNTPLKYLTACRIREACRLLRETDLSIAQVGEAVGYPDQFHFSKTFRKATGVSPTVYRKEPI